MTPRPRLDAPGAPTAPLRPALAAAALLTLAAAILAPIEHAWTGTAMRATARALRPVQDFVDVGAAFGATAGIALIAALVVALDPRWRATLPPLVPGVFVLGLVNGALKLVFRRQRPMWDDGRDFVLGVPADQAGHWFITPPTWKQLFDERFLSFPSGHSAAAAYLAAALSAAYPRGRAVWWTLAVLCMVSRFEGARHYLADCCAGAAVGIAVFAASRRVALYAPLTRLLEGGRPGRAGGAPAGDP